MSKELKFEPIDKSLNITQICGFCKHNSAYHPDAWCEQPEDFRGHYCMVSGSSRNISSITDCFAEEGE